MVPNGRQGRFSGISVLVAVSLFLVLALLNARQIVSVAEGEASELTVHEYCVDCDNDVARDKSPPITTTTTTTTTTVKAYPFSYVNRVSIAQYRPEAGTMAMHNGRVYLRRMSTNMETMLEHTVLVYRKWFKSKWEFMLKIQYGKAFYRVVVNIKTKEAHYIGDSNRNMHDYYYQNTFTGFFRIRTSRTHCRSSPANFSTNNNLCPFVIMPITKGGTFYLTYGGVAVANSRSFHMTTTKSYGSMFFVARRTFDPIGNNYDQYWIQNYGTRLLIKGNSDANTYYPMPTYIASGASVTSAHSTLWAIRTSLQGRYSYLSVWGGSWRHLDTQNHSRARAYTSYSTVFSIVKSGGNSHLLGIRNVKVKHPYGYLRVNGRNAKDLQSSQKYSGTFCQYILIALVHDHRSMLKVSDYQS